MKKVLVLSTAVVVLSWHVPATVRQPEKTAVRALQSTRPNSVSYDGVSFDFDSTLAKQVEAQTIPASLDGKPSDIWPEHPAFSLLDYSRPRGVQENAPHLRIFPLKKFRDAVEFATKEFAKSVGSTSNLPSWTVYFDEEVRVLKALLAQRPSSSNVSMFLKRTRNNDDVHPQMPFLPMWEGTQAFIAHIKYVDFEKGKGVFFLTQWNNETSQITNDGLEYAFQGITNDERHYIYAEFSVVAPNLPQGDEPEVVAWDEKNYLLGHRSKKYQEYLRPVLAKLEALPGNQFQPKLELFERLVGSLKVEAK